MIPGYFSYVQGEVSKEYYDHQVDDLVKEIFYIAMYQEINQMQTFYRVGINRMIDRLQILLRPVERNLIPKQWRECFYYFYNRQLIVQMTSKPKPFENGIRGEDIPLRHISVPLERKPNREVQVDIMQLLPHQLKHNHKWKFMVVIVDPFSRFIWSFPVASLESKKVSSAFAKALSRPGLALEYYEFIRDKVERVVVDGGSEFKDIFRTQLHFVFPNAELYVSSAKRSTHGRPTGNGPIEAAIGTFRRVMRDHEIGISPEFYGTHTNAAGDVQTQFGLGRILQAYNQIPQTGTLRRQCPVEVVLNILRNNVKSTNELQMHMDQQRERKMQLVQTQRRQVGARYLVSGEHESLAYRIFIPKHAFGKEVDFCVSLELYYIERIHDDQQRVDLRQVGGGKPLAKVRISSLVLVKTPVENGPEIIYQHLKNNTTKIYFIQLQNKWPVSLMKSRKRLWMR